MRATQSAFKEWHAVCRALGAGVQTVVLRKGGIAEPPGGFRPDRPEFVLLPTAFHQSAAALKPEYAGLVERPAAGRSKADPILVEFAATMAQSHCVSSEEALQAIRDEHVWSDEVARERLRRGPALFLYVLVLRVYALPRPVSVALSEKQLGCKSWIDLSSPIVLEGARAVLSDEEFERRRARIAARLGAASGGREAPPRRS